MTENPREIAAVLNAAKARIEQAVDREVEFRSDEYSAVAKHVGRTARSDETCDWLGVSLISSQDAQRYLATQRQIGEFRRNISNFAAGDRPRIIRAVPHSDGNLSVVDDYLSNGYVAHATYRPFEKLVPQYPRRPGATWMGRPIPLAWATSRSDRAMFWGLCERPGIEGGSCTHFSPDRSDMLVTYDLPRGTQQILASPENRGYVMMFRNEGWRKATAQQMYVTDRPMIPDAIVEITPDAWTGPPITELPDRPVPRRPHQPFGYEFDDEQHVCGDSDSTRSVYTSTATTAPRLAPCAYGKHVRIPVDHTWTPDIEWRKGALSPVPGIRSGEQIRLWTPDTPAPPWPANQID